MEMTDLEILIRDLEQAPEGSRELSDRVLLACGWDHKELPGPLTGKNLLPCWIAPDGTKFWSCDIRSDPTHSLDDAVALVPQDFKLDRLQEMENGRFSFTIMPRFLTESRKGCWSFATTPALAICIAVLKARKP